MKRGWIGAAVFCGVALLGGIGYAGYLSNRPVKPTAVEKPDTSVVERCDVEQSVSAPGSAGLTRVEGVRMPAEGRLAEVLVYAGQKVKQGQTLARLDDRQKYEAAAAAARLALLEAQRRLQEVREQAPLKTAQAHTALLEAQKKLQTAQSRRLSKAYGFASPDTIDIARANTMLAKIAMEEAESLWQVNSGRPDDDPEKAYLLSQAAAARHEYYRQKANLDWLLNGPTDLDIAQADTAIALAQAELDAAEEGWQRVKDGPDALLLQQVEAAVAQAEANLQQAENVLENLEIQAPFSGVVTAVNARAGQTLPAAAELFTLIDPAALEVQATVTEEDLPLLREGMAVNLFFDALSDESVGGKIKSIIPQRQGGDSPRYTIYITLDALPAGLADGMSADAAIILERREGVLCLPRGLARASGEGKALVEVWNGSAVEKRELKIGLRGDSSVEILAGIVEGEEVVVK
jgi:HlyD family secretion protein